MSKSKTIRIGNKIFTLSDGIIYQKEDVEHSIEDQLEALQKQVDKGYRTYGNLELFEEYDEKTDKTIKKARIMRGKVVSFKIEKYDDTKKLPLNIPIVNSEGTFTLYVNNCASKEKELICYQLSSIETIILPSDEVVRDLFTIPLSIKGMVEDINGVIHYDNLLHVTFANQTTTLISL